MPNIDVVFHTAQIAYIVKIARKLFIDLAWLWENNSARPKVEPNYFPIITARSMNIARAIFILPWVYMMAWIVMRTIVAPVELKIDVCTSRKWVSCLGFTWIHSCWAINMQMSWFDLIHFIYRLFTRGWRNHNKAGLCRNKRSVRAFLK